jgi:hypothetical protein
VVCLEDGEEAVLVAVREGAVEGRWVLGVVVAKELDHPVPGSADRVPAAEVRWGREAQEPAVGRASVPEEMDGQGRT